MVATSPLPTSMWKKIYSCNVYWWLKKNPCFHDSVSSSGYHSKLIWLLNLIKVQILNGFISTKRLDFCFVYVLKAGYIKYSRYIYETWLLLHAFAFFCACYLNGNLLDNSCQNKHIPSGVKGFMYFKFNCTSFLWADKPNYLALVIILYTFHSTYCGLPWG